MLVLLQELLARIVVGEKARQLLGQLDQALDGMCGILNALVDGNQVEPARRSIEPGCSAAAAPGSAPVVCVVDDDRAVREAIRSLLEQHGHHVEDFADGEAFLDAYRPGRHGCVLIDAHLPGISGLDLLRRLQDDGHLLPAIIITGQSDVPMAVEAMKAGASDFLQKPVRGAELLEGIAHALEVSRDSARLLQSRQQAVDHLAGLTRRQHQIMALVLAGHPSKNIAADLGISQRTVENHRASIMKKSGTRSLPALARLALAAADSHDRPTA
jgi:two-component system CheB/CheR fusion protein